MSDYNGIIDQLKILISEAILPLDDNISPQDSLYEEGLDSMGIMQLILRMESDFQIRIKAEDMTRETFESLSSLANLIISQKGKG